MEDLDHGNVMENLDREIVMENLNDEIVMEDLNKEVVMEGLDNETMRLSNIKNDKTRNFPYFYSFSEPYTCFVVLNFESFPNKILHLNLVV